MSNSRKSHVRNLYDLRFSFKYVLHKKFFSNPVEFLDNYSEGKLVEFLQNLWSEHVKNEQHSPESYTTEFDINNYFNEKTNEIFLMINLPDIIDINNPQIEYSWHESLAVSFILYFNFDKKVVKFYVCESSMNSSMNNARLNGEYIPVYFVVELNESERRNLGTISSNFIEEVKTRFFVAVGDDLEQLKHSLLWNAIINNVPLEEIKKMIEAGADLNEVDENGLDILALAVSYHNNHKVIKLLIDKGLPLDKKYLGKGLNLAHLAALYNRNPQVMQTLIDCGIIFDCEEESNGNTPLGLAAIHGDVGLCKLLLKAGSRLEAKNHFWITPLMLSTRNRNPDVCRFLLKSGANVNALDSSKQCVLTHAIGSSSYELVKEITELLKTKIENFDQFYKDSIEGTRQSFVIASSKPSELSDILEPDRYKKMNIPFMFAAENPDLRVLDYLQEKEWEPIIGLPSQDVFNFALEANPNPAIINYVFEKKIYNENPIPFFTSITKNQNIEVWKNFLSIFPQPKEFIGGLTYLMMVFNGKGNPNPEVVDLLADENIVNLKNDRGQTVVHYAITKNQLIYFDILKKAGANFNEKDNFGNTPLMFACSANSNPDIIDFLIENGADINERDSIGNDALLWSMSNPNLEIIKHLVDLGADVHTKNRNGENILIAALQNKANLEIINYVISLEINVNEKGNSGLPTIAFAAAYNPFPEVLDLLIKKGEDINYKSKDNVNLLHLAASKNSSEKVIEYLLDKGIDINSLTSRHETPLILSVSRNPNFNIFEKLLEKGANLHDTDEAKNNLLHFAAGWNENPIFIEYLLNNGFSINDRDSSGNTPVIYAAQNCNINIIKMLVEKGADPTKANDLGITPLFLCSNGDLGNNIEMARYLIEKGVDVNAKTDEGRTALMQAACNITDTEYIEVLIAAGADVYAETNNGYNAYKVAIENNPNPAVAETIKKYMTMASFKETSFNIPSKGDLN